MSRFYLSGKWSQRLLLVGVFAGIALLFCVGSGTRREAAASNAVSKASIRGGGLLSGPAYYLDVPGFGSHLIGCAPGREQRISVAPEGRRLAYDCGLDWWTVYLESGAQWPAPPQHDAPDWAKTPDFAAVAPELAEFANELPGVLAAVKARHLDVADFLWRNFELGPTYQWETLVRALPDAQKADVTGRLERFRQPTQTPVHLRQLDAVMEMLGFAEADEAVYLELFRRAVAVEPTGKEWNGWAGTVIGRVQKLRGRPAATRFACIAVAAGVPEQLPYALLAGSDMSCPAYDAWVQRKLASPAIACNRDLHCEHGCGVDGKPEAWEANKGMHDDDAELIAVLAAQRRHLSLREVELAARRASYVVQMPQTPLCDDAAPGHACSCAFTLCAQTRDTHPPGCELRFHDAKKTVDVVAARAASTTAE